MSMADEGVVGGAVLPCEAGAAAVGLETVSDPTGAAFIEVGLAPWVILEASPRDAPATNKVSAAVCFEFLVPRDMPAATDGASSEDESS